MYINFFTLTTVALYRACFVSAYANCWISHAAVQVICVAGIITHYHFIYPQLVHDYTYSHSFFSDFAGARMTALIFTYVKMSDDHVSSSVAIASDLLDV